MTIATDPEPSGPAVLPRWIHGARAETCETMAFSAGAALAVLDHVLQDPRDGIPADLLRERMALTAAAACLRIEGRRASPAQIRDAVCLARAGDALGPAGDMFCAWRRFARVPLRGPQWPARLAAVLPAQVADLLPELGRLQGTPAAEAARVLGSVLQKCPRHEAAALMLADAALARTVGWERPLPLLAAYLTRADLRAIASGQNEPALRLYRALITACDATLREAADLSRRAARLRAIAPKLRAKGAEQAVALFLRLDAVAPSGMLSPRVQGTDCAMSDRAARRLCERLVSLGAVRELTGRASFRLYGV